MLPVIRISGEDAATPPIVLVHGFLSSAQEDFGPWLERLSAAGRRAIAVELPAHGAAGASGPPDRKSVV